MDHINFFEEENSFWSSTKDSFCEKSNKADMTFGLTFEKLWKRTIHYSELQMTGHFGK